MWTVFVQGRPASSEEGSIATNSSCLSSLFFSFFNCQKAKFKIQKLSELIWRLSIARREGGGEKKK
jgi:hypothetical protein